MSHRAAVLTPRTPFFLILPGVRRELKKAGGELVRMVMKGVKGHCYDVRVRTRTVYRALCPEQPRADPYGYSVAVADP